MIESALKQLKDCESQKDKLCQAFYYTVRSEVVKESNQDLAISDRKSAQAICSEIDNLFYEYFMKIKNAVVTKKSLHGISTLTIVDEGEIANRDIAANALDVVWLRLSYDQIEFIDNYTLVELFNQQGLAY